MLNKKRDRLRIIRDILYSIQIKGEKVKPTHILYRSNLSSDMLKQYLFELISNNFIIESKSKKGSKEYSLTEKGFKYIKEYKFIIDFIESYGLG